VILTHNNAIIQSFLLSFFNTFASEKQQKFSEQFGIAQLTLVLLFKGTNEKQGGSAR
jgi:hypothetical protein